MTLRGSEEATGSPLIAARPAELRAAYATCRAVTRNRARNFYWGLRLTPEPKRSAMYAIYAWMRFADDIADSHLDRCERQQRIESFRNRTRRVVEACRGPGAEAETVSAGPAGNGNEVGMWLAFADTVRTFHIDPGDLWPMIDSQLSDLQDLTYETFDDLYTYCFGVASTVGLVSITVWGYDDPRARQLAEWRGIAFQLTNILRDFAEDFDRGRTYLPRTDFRRFGITPQQLREWSNPAACAQLVEFEIERAVSYFDRSADLDELIDPTCAPTLRAMTEIYSTVLARLRRDPHRVVGPLPVRLRRSRKALIALKAAWHGRRARR